MRPLLRPTGYLELYPSGLPVLRPRIAPLLVHGGIVRPTLEYIIFIWSPYLKKDQDIVSAVQYPATKMVPGVQDLPYEGRLQPLQLPSLTYRR